MAIPQSAHPALQLVAVFSRHTAALQWAAEKIAEAWGPIALQSEPFDHSETEYYTNEMGRGLQKQFYLLQPIFDPARLPESKLQSNAWEHQLAESRQYPEPRPINIDPGYVTLTKLVLASAKDRAHRIYLNHGIYAEECLYYLGGAWHARPWTYPDYQRADFQAFFVQAREHLKHCIQEMRGE